MLDAFLLAAGRASGLLSMSVRGRNHERLDVVASRMRARTRRWRPTATFLLSAKIVLCGALIAKEDPVVVKVEVPMPNLPASLDGYRIIQLSDVHVGVSVGRTRVERTVGMVNELCRANAESDGRRKCDLIALTGDLIDGDPRHLTRAIEPLGRLVPDADRLFVTGNHEIMHGNADGVISALSRIGIESLVNANVRLPRDGGGDAHAPDRKIVVVGLEDYSSLRGSRETREEASAFDGGEQGVDAIVLLAHQPNHLASATRGRGVGLALSGHTHAGQFFPGTLGAWLLNARYSGYYPPSSRNHGAAVYVSAGTHWWGPPVRFTTRHHEITDVRLVRRK